MLQQVIGPMDQILRLAHCNLLPAQKPSPIRVALIAAIAKPAADTDKD
jgi:hypothetical protein